MKITATNLNPEGTMDPVIGKTSVTVTVELHNVLVAMQREGGFKVLENGLRAKLGMQTIPEAPVRKRARKLDATVHRSR